MLTYIHVLTQEEHMHKAYVYKKIHTNDKIEGKSSVNSFKMLQYYLYSSALNSNDFLMSSFSDHVTLLQRISYCKDEKSRPRGCTEKFYIVFGGAFLVYPFVPYLASTGD